MIASIKMDGVVASDAVTAPVSVVLEPTEVDVISCARRSSNAFPLAATPVLAVSEEEAVVVVRAFLEGGGGPASFMVALAGAFDSSLVARLDLAAPAVVNDEGDPSGAFHGL